MGTAATRKKVKKLSVKKVTIKDLGVPHGKADALKGGQYTYTSCPKVGGG